jgi:threonine synthase
MKALKCRECGREYPLEATHVCEFDFGPLEVAYDYDRIKKSLTRAAIQSRPKTMWRYRELLPIAGEPTVGRQVGFTPLVKAAPGEGARHPRTLRQERRRELSDAFVQGPRRQRGLEPGEGAGF